MIVFGIHCTFFIVLPVWWKNRAYLSGLERPSALDRHQESNFFRPVQSHKMKILMVIIISLAVTRLTNLTKQKILSKNFLVSTFHKAQT